MLTTRRVSEDLVGPRCRFLKLHTLVTRRVSEGKYTIDTVPRLRVGLPISRQNCDSATSKLTLRVASLVKQDIGVGLTIRWRQRVFEIWRTRRAALFRTKQFAHHDTFNQGLQQIAVGTERIGECLNLVFVR